MAKTIKDYSIDYQNARAAGNAAGMQAANEGANALRIAAGELPEYATTDIQTVRNQTKAPQGFTGSSNQVGTNSTSQDTIRGTMQANSRAWHETDDPAEKQRLHKENVRLARQLGGDVRFDAGTGTWSGNAEKEDFSYRNASSYADKYSKQIDALLGDITNRKAFSYDAEEDPLYQQYRQQYTAAGRQAMEDTLGQVAARTGGLASSYAGTASQQAYDSYMAQLANKIPELYQLAYSMYQDDLSNRRADLNMLQNLSDSEYSRYNADRGFDYNVWQGNENQRQWQENMNYQRARDNLADQQWQRNYDYQTGRDLVSDQQWREGQDTNRYQWQQGYNLDNKEFDLTTAQFEYQKQQDALDRAYRQDADAYERAMERWELMGVADATVAKVLGVPQGTQTTDWQYKQAQIFSAYNR